MAYNGHKNRNHWNVALWMANDEGLYRLAKEAITETGTLDKATDWLYDTLQGQKTPDGAPYSKSAIRQAIREF